MGRFFSVGPRLLPAVLVLVVLAVLPLTASGQRATPGVLTHVRDDANCIASYLRDRCSVGVSMKGIEDVVVSRDGKSIYASGERGITILRRDLRTGAISQASGPNACATGRPGISECRFLEGLPSDGVTELTLSPDDETLYVASPDGTLSVIDRAGDGTLSQAPGPAGCIGPDPAAVVYQGENPSPPDEQRECAPMADAPEIGSLTFAPSGDTGFMSYGDGPSRIAAFRRIATGGFELLRTAETCVRGSSFFGNLGPCSEAAGYGGGTPALAPGAKALYAVSGQGDPDGGSAAFAFQTDVEAGAISPAPGEGFCASSDGLSGADYGEVSCSRVRGMDTVREFEVGDDALYVLADGKRLVVLDRAEDESLSQLSGRPGCASTGGGNCVNVLGMKGAMSMELTDDDASVYVSGWADDTVATIALNKGGHPTGPVTKKPPCLGGSYRSPCKDIPNVTGWIDSIAAAPDGESVYMAGDEAIVGFDRGPVGRPAVAKRRMTLRLSDRPLRRGVQRIRWRVRIRSSEPECIADQEVWARALHDGGGYGSLGPIRTNQNGRATARGRVYGDSRVVALVHGDTTCEDVRSNKVRVEVGGSR